MLAVAVGDFLRTALAWGTSLLFLGSCGRCINGTESPGVPAAGFNMDEWGFRMALNKLLHADVDEAWSIVSLVHSCRPEPALVCNANWSDWLDQHLIHFDAPLREEMNRLQADWLQLKATCSDSRHHASVWQGTVVDALDSCIAAFNEGWFGSLSGVSEATSNLFAQSSEQCVKLGGVALGFEPGLEKRFADEVVTDLLHILRLRLDDPGLLIQIQSFLVCVPPAPVCTRDHGMYVGWHFFLRHVLVVPEWLLGFPAPSGAHVWARAGSPHALEAFSVELARRHQGGAFGEVNTAVTDRNDSGRAVLVSNEAQHAKTGFIGATASGCHLEGHKLECCSTVPPGLGVAWQGASEALPDFDCLSSPVPGDILGLVEMLAGTVALYTTSGSARHSAWEGEDAEREVWMNYAMQAFGYADASSDEALEEECPFAFYALQVARWTVCFFLGAGTFAPQHSGCEGLRVSLGRVLLGMPWGLCEPREALPVFLNTRWLAAPCFILMRLRVLVQSGDPQDIDPDGSIRDDFDCRQQRAASAINWDEYGARVAALDYAKEETMEYWSKSKLYGSQVTTADECLLGLTSMMLEKLRVAQAGRTEDYGQFAESVGYLFARFEVLMHGRVAPRDALGTLLLTRWPITSLVCSIGFQAQAMKVVAEGFAFGYQHKPYDLDFHPDEILRPPEHRQTLAALRAMPRAEHISLLRQTRRNRKSPTFQSLLSALVVSLGEPSALAPASKLVVVSIVWGDRLAVYFEGWLRRAAAYGLARSSLLFCLDDAACTTCRAVHSHPTNCVPGRIKTIFNKYTVMSAIINSGIDAVYLDFDTIMLRDPIGHIQHHAKEAEILVSADFGCECLNTGVIYFKAHPDVADFLHSLLVWLWHHPYEFSQKAFSAMLGKENVSHVPLGIAVPRWGILDRYTQFVTSMVYSPETEGWTGDMDDILIYHFLDGTGGVDKARAVSGEYLNLYDLFYANDALNLSDTLTPLWRQDARVELSLWRSWKPNPPDALLPCMLLPSSSLR